MGRGGARGPPRSRAPAGSGALSSQVADGSCPGPVSAEEFGQWDRVYAQLFQPYYTRISDIMRHGVIATTDYSGYDSPRECMRILTPSIFAAMQKPVPQISFLRSCDWGRLQQKVLLHQSVVWDEGSVCLFDNIADRLSSPGVNFIADRPVQKNMPMATRADRNKEILSALLDCRHSWNPVDAVCPCLVHKKLCPVHAGWAWQQKRERKLADIMSAKNREMGPVVDRLDNVWQDFRETLPMPPSFEPWWEAPEDNSSVQSTKN